MKRVIPTTTRITSHFQKISKDNLSKNPIKNKWSKEYIYPDLLYVKYTVDTTILNNHVNLTNSDNLDSKKAETTNTASTFKTTEPPLTTQDKNDLIDGTANGMPKNEEETSTNSSDLIKESNSTTTTDTNHPTDIDKEKKVKLACFDLDGTLITTKSGQVFATNENDWKLLFPCIKNKLDELIDSKYKIVIFSNQKGLRRSAHIENTFLNKTKHIFSHLDISLELFAATMQSYYRKPSPGMWNNYVQTCKFEVDKENSFYVGDAAGRKSTPLRKADFSDSDKIFARNCQLNFYTPEEYFLSDTTYCTRSSVSTIKLENKNNESIKIKEN